MSETERFKKVRIKEIAKLSDKYPVWKIHSLGEVFVNDVTSDLNIDVLLVPLKNAELYKTINKELLTENRFFDFSESRIVSVSIGLLPILKIGTFYYKGYPQIPHTFLTRTFDFTVKEDNQEIISAGSAWGKYFKKIPDKNDKLELKERQIYFIPGSQYNLFPNTTGRFRKPFSAKYLLIDFPPDEKPTVPIDYYPFSKPQWKSERENKIIEVFQNYQSFERDLADVSASPGQMKQKVHGLIIPTIEVIRFYYTFSTRLAQEMFFIGQDKREQRLFSEERTIRPGADGRNGFLMLSKWMRNKDRFVISRLAFDDYAMSQGRGIYTSILNNKRREGLRLPEAKFPYKDEKTKLTVHGTYIQSGKRVYFLVSWIKSCSAPLPYLEASYWRTNPGRMKIQSMESGTDDDTLKNKKEDEDKPSTDTGEDKDKVKEPKVRTTNETDEYEFQDEIPTGDVAENIRLIFDEKNRFLWTQEHPMESEPQDPIKEDIQDDSTTIFIHGNSDEPSPLGAGPVITGGGGTTEGTVTPTELDDDPSGFDDVHDPDFEDIWDMDDIEDWIREEQEDEPDPEDDEEDDAEPDEEFEEPPKMQYEQRNRIPVDSDVFKDILKWLYAINPDLKSRMIKVSPQGKTLTTKSASAFPELWHNPFTDRLQQTDEHESPELYIAEIIYRRKSLVRYAYLMDIKALDKKGDSNSRKTGFQMFLCFNGRTYGKLSGYNLKDILNTSHSNNMRWLNSNICIPDQEKEKMIKKQLERFNYLSRTKFKHNCVTVETYAQRIIECLDENDWFSRNKIIFRKL